MDDFGDGWLSFPSPLVGEGGRDALASRTGEGSVSADRDPSSGASRHLLPQGEKEESQIAPSRGNNPSSTALICSARYFELIRHCGRPPAMNQRPGWPVRVY